MVLRQPPRGTLRVCTRMADSKTMVSIILIFATNWFIFNRTYLISSNLDNHVLAKLYHKSENYSTFFFWKTSL